MKAMVINRIGDISENTDPLECVDLPIPEPKSREVLIKIRCCGVCHTEMDEIEGRTPPDRLPRIPGHQVVGVVERLGNEVTGIEVGNRVGVAWIFNSCGKCDYCLAGDDNLCEQFEATGRDTDGGYAEYMVVPESTAFLLPDAISDLQAAPLLCAGAIGYRSLRLANLKNGQPLGMTGFGASAHLMMLMVEALYPDSPVYVFARRHEEQQFALKLGAKWAGDTNDSPPEQLQAIIDTTPAWLPVVKAMEMLKPGGRLVINAIRKEEKDKSALVSVNYERHLWQEKEIKSVANVARRDVTEFLALAARIGIEPEVQVYSLLDANDALRDLKLRAIRGAKVLVVDSSM